MERMDGGDRVIRRRKSLIERLGLKGIGCCGSTWGVMSTSSFNVMDRDNNNNNDEIMSHHHHIHTSPPDTALCLAVEGSPRMNLRAALAAELHDNNNNNNEIMSHHHIHTSPPEISPDTALCLAVEGSPRMNLRAALAAERHEIEVNTNSDSSSGPDSSSGHLRPDESVVPGTPSRMSLMRLLEETEVYEGELLMEKEEEGVGVGVGVGGSDSDNVCCVCMRRKKGAAFIPCGHTFCRVCSRELWVNRGCCPLCNRSILEILDIY